MTAPRIAIVHPLGDYGISSYVHLAAEAVGALGVPVEVFTVPSPVWRDIPAPLHYTLSTLLGGLIFRQPPHGVPPVAVATPPQAGTTNIAASGQSLRTILRPRVLSLELALQIRRRGYNTVWTQWPDMADYGLRFWDYCRWAGLTVIHSVHNVLPHEETSGMNRLHGEVYKRCHRLVVHSEAARSELERHFPETVPKIVVARMGVYDIYPRCPQCRAPMREQLGISESQTAVLFPGAVRPYKNVDAVLEAMTDPRCRSLVLVMAGRESGYTDFPAGELHRTRHLANRLGVASRVHLISRSFTNEEMSALYETADAVVMPYIQGYGSAVLPAAMWFGAFIISTDVGGAGEYLREYSPCRILPAPTKEAVLEAMLEAHRLHRTGGLKRTSAQYPSWTEFARTVMRTL